MQLSEGESKTQANGISADEVALYDRQIRLWGMEAQERMRNARVLLISMRALANEVAKNLVLAGIGSLTILDEQTVSEHDIGAQFLVSQDDIGRNRGEAAAENARKLNPRVNIDVDQQPVKEKEPVFFTQFDIVVACDQDLNEMIRINNACRSAKKPFYGAEIPGMTGYVFADLVDHDFVTEREVTSASGERQKVTVPAHETYISLEEALKHDYGASLRPKLRKKVSAVLPLTIALLKYRADKHKFPQAGQEDYAILVKKTSTECGLPESLTDAHIISEYLEGCDCELSAIAAIVGGVLSQDVLNVLSRRESPVQNCFIYDGNTGEGPIYHL